ncbi:MAG: GatB/YqeY domain-containing protein [Acidimicrobiales bacterium]
MSLPDRVQADLLVARKARDEHAVTALRTLLAAFSNAEAPSAPGSSSLDPKVIGLAEHDRLVLSDEDHQRILEEEIAIREAAAAEYDAIGQTDAAAAVRAENNVLCRYR